MKTPGFVFPSLLAAAHLLYAATGFAATEPFPVLPLADGWTLQSSGKVAETGDVISTPVLRAERVVHGYGANHGGGRIGKAEGLS